ncbi:J domain-containing protein [Rhizobium sp. TH2]|uniref:J domain-containing protein n=1 Tax=Rhizobium sp. TH2 TaxID=2775403 RepID=UPI00215748CF|nr:J domain-containing protein [Rhizobium sp. TH2]
MRHSDPEGLYRALGVMPTADQEEIKNAYRRLAKETHPDTSSDGSSFHFHKVYNAYKILSDIQSRERYDRRFTRDDEDYSWLGIDPVCCSRCGSATAQPRKLSFIRVYSAVFASFRRPVQGIYCQRCAQTEAIKSSLFTAVFGWWGIPLAPYFTLRAIARNALGGTRDMAAEEQLLWQNSRAFAAKGNRKLSYALARKLIDASDSEVAEGARELVEDMEARGANPRKIKLKDPWRIKPLRAMTHLTLAAILPLGIGGVVLESLQPDNRQETREIAALTYAAVPVDPTTRAILPDTKLKPSPLCWKVPENGEVLYRINPRVSPGHGITLINDTPKEAIVKVRSAFSKRLIAAVYMVANASAELGGIPDGYYVVQYAFGQQLANGCVSFVTTDGAWQFPDTENLRTIATGQGPQHLDYSLSLAPEQGVASPVKPYAFNLN